MANKSESYRFYGALFRYFIGNIVPDRINRSMFSADTISISDTPMLFGGLLTEIVHFAKNNEQN